MPNYIARISLTYTFAQEKQKELGSFWAEFAKKIPPMMMAENLNSRFTYAYYSMRAENKDNCKQIIYDAWQSAFSDTSGISEILVSAYGDDEAGKLIRLIYGNFYGVDDYLRLITNLHEIIPQLTASGSIDLLRKQSYLFAIDQGNGFSTLISSLGDYLHKMNVFKQNEYKCRKFSTEFKIGSENEKGFKKEDSVIEFLENSVTKNPYTVVGIDLSYYLDGRKFGELRDFVQRLEAYQDEFVFAFRIPFLEKKAFDEVYAIISDVVLLRTVQIPPLHDSVLMETVWDLINERGFTPDPSLIDVVFAKIAEEKSDGRFYGFKSINKIVSQIILEKSTDSAKKADLRKEYSTSVIMADDVQGILSNEKVKLTGYKALEELIGMETISKRIKEITAQVKTAIQNEKLDRPCIHMRFTGAPGTGKTTVARIMGEIFREEGILRKGGFFEYKSRDLVAEYVGQTAVKTSSICRDSYGSVLFIDEAYALYESDSTNSDYGKEALTTLVSEMENHRDDMLVIMAGYTDEMDHLMKANPGLRSRMPYVIDFPNYSREQLGDIFMLMVKKHFDYTAEFETEARTFFTNLSEEYLASKEFANARFVRNLYERTWSKGALRSSLCGIKDIVLQKEDFVAAKNEKEFSENLTTTKRIGF